MRNLQRRYGRAVRQFRPGPGNDLHITNGRRTAVIFETTGGYQAIGYVGVGPSGEIAHASPSAALSGKSWKSLVGATRAATRWVEA